jgi:hypothetical protein
MTEEERVVEVGIVRRFRNQAGLIERRYVIVGYRQNFEVKTVI